MYQQGEVHGFDLVTSPPTNDLTISNPPAPHMVWLVIAMMDIWFCFWNILCNRKSQQGVGSTLGLLDPNFLKQGRITNVVGGHSPFGHEFKI